MCSFLSFADIVQRASVCDRGLKITVNGEDIEILHSGRIDIKGKEAVLPHHTYFYAMEKVTTNFYKVRK